MPIIASTIFMRPMWHRCSSKISLRRAVCTALSLGPVAVPSRASIFDGASSDDQANAGGCNHILVLQR
jgi:hypothetical protein